MKKKSIGITLAATAMLAGSLFMPPVEAQNYEAAAAANARQAAEAEAALGESTFGIPRAANQAAIQKKYNDTYNSQLNALRAQGVAVGPNLPDVPYVAPPSVTGSYPYGGYGYYNNHRRRATGRILNH